MPDLLIDSLVIPLVALGDHRQEYDHDLAQYDLRMADGSIVRQTRRSRKLTTTISGSGWMPSGLDDLDTSVPHTISCVAPRSVGGPGPVLILPSARRGDVPISGLVVTAAGVYPCEVDTVVGDVVTLETTPGALTYQAIYYPRFSAWLGYRSDLDANSATYGWTLTAREA